MSLQKSLPAHRESHHEHRKAEGVAPASIDQGLPEHPGEAVLGLVAEPGQVEVDDGAGEGEIKGRTKAGGHTCYLLMCVQVAEG